MSKISNLYKKKRSKWSLNENSLFFMIKFQKNLKNEEKVNKMSQRSFESRLGLWLNMYFLEIKTTIVSKYIILFMSISISSIFSLKKKFTFAHHFFVFCFIREKISDTNHMGLIISFTKISCIFFLFENL